MQDTGFNGEPLNGLKQIGEVVLRYRREKSISQSQLAKKIEDINQTEIAKLEQGYYLPKQVVLDKIGRFLEIPEDVWRILSHPCFLQTSSFIEYLSEMLGKRLAFERLDVNSKEILIREINVFLDEQQVMTLSQACYHFKLILNFFGERSISLAFYKRFLGESNFKSVSQFGSCVRDFQKVAIRIYGTFRRAFKILASCNEDQLEKELNVLLPIELNHYRERRPFNTIVPISESRLDDLGYISAERVRRNNRELYQLSVALNELATYIENDHFGSLEGFSTKKLRRIQTLLRTFDSELQLEETLFSKVDPEEIRKEAIRLSPEDSELNRIAETQESGQLNLTSYITEPIMDIYIATSLRERADFISVRSFTEKVFHSPLLSPLNLRYFNPVYSWVADRVAKGLFDAVMLSRASLIIYMAQKSDTIGKDTVVSQALTTGKYVLLYVPCLIYEPNGINSSVLMQKSISELITILNDLGLDNDEEEEDKIELIRKILYSQLINLELIEFAKLVLLHWADYDLYSEFRSLPNEDRYLINLYLDALISCELDNIPVPNVEIRDALVNLLIHVTLFFERRAYTFKEVHPVYFTYLPKVDCLNGLIVTRSINECINIIHQILSNSLETELIQDYGGYRLVEKATNSTLRVVSKNALISNAYLNQFYLDV
jgi:transcriptional regulator with XRE-family HTH domain